MPKLKYLWMMALAVSVVAAPAMAGGKVAPQRAAVAAGASDAGYDVGADEGIGYFGGGGPAGSHRPGFGHHHYLGYGFYPEGGIYDDFYGHRDSHD